MNIIPWRRTPEASLGLQNPFEDFWKDDWSSLLEPLPYRNRLPAAFRERGTPPMNVSESENQYLVTIDLPGLDVKDVAIELMGNQLHIKGERRWDEEQKGKEFHRVESRYGAFSRVLTLPENARIDRDAIEATFQKGILSIRIPKVEPTPASRIPIQIR